MRAAEALRGAAVAAAAEALQLRGGSGSKSFLLDDATRAFLLRPGRSLRGFSALAGEYGGSRAEEEKEAEAESNSSSSGKSGKSGNGNGRHAATRDRNLVAARALALFSARELVRAASSRHPGLAYAFEARFSMHDGVRAEKYRIPTPSDWEAEVALQVLDAGWGDFLADAHALEAAVCLRVFSAQLDPLEEFRLEAGEMFVQLLRRYRRQVAEELLGGPELVVEPPWETLVPKKKERTRTRKTKWTTSKLLKEKEELEEEEEV